MIFFENQLTKFRAVYTAKVNRGPNVYYVCMYVLLLFFYFIYYYYYY